jgi:hypothetical protein
LPAIGEGRFRAAFFFGFPVASAYPRNVKRKDARRSSRPERRANGDRRTGRRRVDQRVSLLDPTDRRRDSRREEERKKKK